MKKTTTTIITTYFSKKSGNFRFYIGKKKKIKYGIFRINPFYFFFPANIFFNFVYFG